jgi:hypothetical protein
MVIKSAKSQISNIVVKHIMQKSGDLYISKAYLTYEDQNIVSTAKTSYELENKTEVTISSGLFNINQIAIKLNQIYDNPVTYNRVYLCNENEDILFYIDTDLHENILNIYDDFIINISDMTELL